LGSEVRLRAQAWVGRLRLTIFFSCALLCASLALSLYLGDLLSFALVVSAAALAVGSLLALLIWLVIRPSWQKVRFVIPAFLTLALMIPLLPTVRGVAWPLYLWPRQRQLEIFVQDLLIYGRIHEMSDGLRYHKSLNGKHFDASKRVVESPAFPPLVPVLISEHIDPDRYEEFRRLLIRLGFIEVRVTNSYGIRSAKRVVT
jgi:hypothetical protein